MESALLNAFTRSITCIAEFAIRSVCVTRPSGVLRYQ
jgi:hypothetical protein